MDTGNQTMEEEYLTHQIKITDDLKWKTEGSHSLSTILYRYYTLEKVRSPWRKDLHSFDDEMLCLFVIFYFCC